MTTGGNPEPAVSQRQNELARLLTRIEMITAYEDHEDRLGQIGQGIDMVSLRVHDLVTQVQNFDQLEESRIDLARNRLGEKLSGVLGEPVRTEAIEPGALGLQPVEVKMRTASGERIDCSISLDGTLRIHHYEHVDQTSCAQSAQKMAASLPDLMALREEPQLDIAVAAAERVSEGAQDAAALKKLHS